MLATPALAEAGPEAQSLRTLSGWGRYPRAASEILAADAPGTLPILLRGRRGVIARGAGRAYGDAAVGQRTTVLTGALDRLRGFDPATGRLRAEAGVTLADIVRTFLPRGFFPPVVPGTQFVTLGGMIASDVHGKNHHREGGFGAHVEALTLLVVEDDPDAAASLTELLTEAGHNVVGPFHSAAAAEAAAALHSIDAALLDINLSGEMTGVELARVLTDRWAVRVIFISGDVAAAARDLTAIIAAARCSAD